MILAELVGVVGVTGAGDGDGTAAGLGDGDETDVGLGDGDAVVAAGAGLGMVTTVVLSVLPYSQAGPIARAAASALVGMDASQTTRFRFLK